MWPWAFTDCAAWDVRAMAAHVVGAMEGFSSFNSMRRLMSAAKKAKGDGKVSPKAIEKAAKAEGVDGARKKLTGPEMRKCIEDLALVTSYPKVAAIGQAIKECFDSITTDGQMSKKLAAITGELKATSRK